MGWPTDAQIDQAAETLCRMAEIPGGHLMPGNESEAAGLLDSYLERANTAARMAQVSA
jgi:hypothetical protein